LTAASGFQIDNVGGTCGGSLAGNVYTTNAVTADCTVIANFVTSGGGTDPVIDVDPASLGFTVDAGANDSAPLTIANIGGGTLTWAISEGEVVNRPSQRAARASKLNLPVQGTLQQSTLPPGIVGTYRAPLGGDVLSQMADNAPASLAGIACGTSGVSAAANSYWRRFYLSEHGGPSSITIESVTVGTETGPSIPATINLYSIPHATPIDTIPLASLTPIGSGTGTVGGDLTTTTIAVAGTLADAAGNDLVVEYHIDGSPTGPWFPGANASTETHPSFISAADCGLTAPTPMSAIGFPDSHNIIVVNLGTGGGPTCPNPAAVPWLTVSPAAGSLAGGASQDATVSVDATGMAAGSYSANLCVTSNDAVTPLVNVPVSLTVEAVVGLPCSAADTIFCDGFDPASAPFEQPVQDPSFEATTADAGSNPFWEGTDSNDPGGTPFYSDGFGIDVHTGSWEAG